MLSLTPTPPAALTLLAGRCVACFCVEDLLALVDWVVVPEVRFGPNDGRCGSSRGAFPEPLAEGVCCAEVGRKVGTDLGATAELPRCGC